jgi:hypothetical protein
MGAWCPVPFSLTFKVPTDSAIVLNTLLISLTFYLFANERVFYDRPPVGNLTQV